MPASDLRIFSDSPGEQMFLDIKKQRAGRNPCPLYSNLNCVLEKCVLLENYLPVRANECTQPCIRALAF
jgi:hypothetical protein